MKFGDFKSQPPKVGMKVQLAPADGSWYSESSIHEVMRQYGFEQAERRNSLEWRTKYQIPRKSWQRVLDELYLQGGVKVTNVV